MAIGMDIMNPVISKPMQQAVQRQSNNWAELRAVPHALQKKSSRQKQGANVHNSWGPMRGNRPNIFAQCFFLTLAAHSPF